MSTQVKNTTKYTLMKNPNDSSAGVLGYLCTHINIISRVVKPMRRNIIVLFTLALLLVSCNKRETPKVRFVSANADNYMFFSTGTMLKRTKTNSGTGPALVVEGIMASGATMKFYIDGYTGALDTFMLDSIQSVATYLSPTPAVETYSVRGHFIITKSTPDLIGEFSFVCSDSTKVVGTFNLAP